VPSLPRAESTHCQLGEQRLDQTVSSVCTSEVWPAVILPTEMADPDGIPARTVFFRKYL
jgi:hypothetical protein